MAQEATTEGTYETRDFFCPECSRWVEAKEASVKITRRGNYFYPDPGMDYAVVATPGFTWVRPLDHDDAHGTPCVGYFTTYYVGDTLENSA